ncbi:MAG TPA: MotA/TolQ/ExbB proton channel family protein [Solirubrobacterales bacterium]|jgi:biopolymer transport protein ExbB/TolQ|nr:MotA/TolQ/ExbB proton channel family protein [Solirubrobacterales bacterium]HMU25936.1 MotA/TolQ/ExbB proton channel family protein [Solirubrobacterales bacterium]HMW44401.1 MotA/TolQ/ExbB proton channel family protein [Solirubrobacterales bacterium]HMX70383.1 MotA/TolQ/ExbB proton channel family protein [Solirubrobacterales bacterium]HMY25288.1 MotA/TolQ/ExbB proton channel family protein [Solirubrobacterales bacterium]
MQIENFLFSVSDALRWPVLVAVLLALAWSIVEIGILLAEIWRRRWRSINALENAVDQAEVDIVQGDQIGAISALSSVSWSRPMRETMTSIVTLRPSPDAENRIAKRLADYDYNSLRRLERTRILVRMGPALGLMGTLIPLAPALAGLADGNVTELTDNLRVAFGVTVAGLLTGALSFGVSLIRDRIYAQDFSDVEFAAANLAPDKHLAGHFVPSPVEHGHSTQVSMGNP